MAGLIPATLVPCGGKTNSSDTKEMVVCVEVCPSAAHAAHASQCHVDLLVFWDVNVLICLDALMYRSTNVSIYSGVNISKAASNVG